VNTKTITLLGSKEGIPMSEMLTVNLGEKNGIKAFNSWDELRNWYSEERNKWNWLGSDNSTKASEIQRNFAHFNLLINRIDIPGDNTPKEQKVESFIVIESLGNSYKNGSIIYSESERGTFLIGLAKKGTTRALSALDHLTDVPIPNNGDWVRAWERSKGVVDAILFEKEIIGMEGQVDRLGKILANHNEAFKIFAAGISSKEQELNQEIDFLQNEKGRVFQAWSTFFEKAKDEKDTEIASLRQKTLEIEQHYREKVQLKAPVDYWQNQVAIHQKWSIIYFAIFAVTTALSLWGLVELALFAQAKWQHLGYERYALLAIFVTIGGTVIRLLYKLYINNVHGKNVAEEKVLQIKTFLALGAEGNKMGPNELNLLLASVLRPRSTSLLKDEFPSVLPIEVLQKVIQPGKS
jgi:hypothetical protein